MNCKDARKEFLTLLDGDLGLTERAPLEVHLDECRECFPTKRILIVKKLPAYPYQFNSTCLISLLEM